jgi:DNA-binding transcriptional MerR regulator
VKKTYTIHEVAEVFSLPISTLRYYDKRGLLPFVSKNEKGYRQFTNSDLRLIKTICCLKDTGMPIQEMKQYIALCLQGIGTIEKRATMLQAHKKQVLQKQKAIDEALDEIDKKIAGYTDPNAKRFVQSEIDYVVKEKEVLHLESAFKSVVEE